MYLQLEYLTKLIFFDQAVLRMRSKGSKYDINVSCIGQSFIAAVHYKFVNKIHYVELASS